MNDHDDHGGRDMLQLADHGFDPSALTHREKLTWDRQKAFLAAYAECGSIRKAAPATDINRSTVRLWAKDDVFRFRERLDNAQHKFREMLQDLAVSRVKNQPDSANPLLLIALLNAHWPEKYRPNERPTDDTALEALLELRRSLAEERRALNEGQLVEASVRKAES